MIRRTPVRVLPGPPKVLGRIPWLVPLAVILAFNTAADDQQSPWFGLTLPPPFDDTAPLAETVRGPESAKFAVGESKYPALRGERIWRDLEQIIAFSQQSRQSREVGSGQFWGRISGLPSGEATIQWAAEQLEDAGIEQVALQDIHQGSERTLWLPLNWQLTLHGDPAFGAGSGDLILESAMPLPPSQLAAAINKASLVYVGTGTAAESTDIDVSNKIVLQKVTPQAHTVFERRPTVTRAQNFFQRGALAVINIVDLPGNVRARDFSNCGGPCFNLGGRDGHFLVQVLEQAAGQKLLDKVRLSVSLQTREFSNLSAQNAIAVIPAKRGSSTAAETIVINAHADAWFDGAGDNGDGLAVMLGLARHFAERPQKRTLVFVASAGHHTPGLHGPRAAVARNPELMNNAQAIINIEHIAQRNIAPARLLYEDGYRQFTADGGEAPIVAGVSNRAPWLQQLIADGVQRFGVNFVGAPSDMASGEGGGYRQLNKAIITTMQAPPLYHTSGENIEAISAPGLEKMAHFLADFIKQLAEAPAEAINPP